MQSQKDRRGGNPGSSGQVCRVISALCGAVGNPGQAPDGNSQVLPASGSVRRVEASVIVKKAVGDKPVTGFIEMYVSRNVKPTYDRLLGFGSIDKLGEVIQEGDRVCLGPLTPESHLTGVQIVVVDLIRLRIYGQDEANIVTF